MRIIDKLKSSLNSYIQFFSKRFSVGASSNEILFFILICLIPPTVLFLMFYGIISGLDNLLFSRTERVSSFTENSGIQKQIQEENKIKDLEKKFERINIPYSDPNGRFRIDFATPYYSGHIVVIIYKPNEKKQVLEEVNIFIKKMKDEGVFESVTYTEN